MPPSTRGPRRSSARRWPVIRGGGLRAGGPLPRHGHPAADRLFHKRKQTYGSPRITADLREMGWQVSPNTVAALMREQGLVARRKRRRHGTTKPDKSARKAPDLLR